MDIPHNGTTLRSLPQWPDYWAGSDGNIYSTKKGDTPVQLSPMKTLYRTTMRHPFMAVTMYATHIRKPSNPREMRPTPCLIHRLVASVWLPPRPSPDHAIDHVDGDRSNNTPQNLEWVTVRENAQRWHRQNPNYNRDRATLTPDDVREIRRLKGTMNNRTIAEQYGISVGHVSHVHCYRVWKDIV